MPPTPSGALVLDDALDDDMGRRMRSTTADGYGLGSDARALDDATTRRRYESTFGRRPLDSLRWRAGVPHDREPVVVLEPVRDLGVSGAFLEAGVTAISDASAERMRVHGAEHNVCVYMIRLVAVN